MPPQPRPLRFSEDAVALLQNRYWFASRARNGARIGLGCNRLTNEDPIPIGYLDACYVETGDVLGPAHCVVTDKLGHDPFPEKARRGARTKHGPARRQFNREEKCRSLPAVTPARLTFQSVFPVGVICCPSHHHAASPRSPSRPCACRGDGRGWRHRRSRQPVGADDRDGSRRRRRHVGHIYVITTLDGLIVKRMGRGEGGGWLLVSDNDSPDWPDVPWPDDAVVTGEVKWMARELP